MKKKLIVSALMTALLGTSALAMAQQKPEEGNWLVRARAVGLYTEQKNDAFSGGNQDALKVSNSFLPELVNSTTKCNFDKRLVAKDILVFIASRPASQSSHDLSTP